MLVCATLARVDLENTPMPTGKPSGMHYRRFNHRLAFFARLLLESWLATDSLGQSEEWRSCDARSVTGD